jgi:hypothetical protein
MLFMNSFDQEHALMCATELGNPRQVQAATALMQLAQWADANSDGWAYWPAPVKAARRLIAGLQQMEADQRFKWSSRRDVADFSAQELEFMIAPVRTFLQRHEARWQTALPVLEEQPGLFVA